MKYFKNNKYSINLFQKHIVFMPSLVSFDCIGFNRDRTTIDHDYHRPSPSNIHSRSFAITYPHPLSSANLYHQPQSSALVRPLSSIVRYTKLFSIIFRHRSRRSAFVRIALYKLQFNISEVEIYDIFHLLEEMKNYPENLFK